MTAGRHLLAVAAILILASVAPVGAAQVETVRQNVHMVVAGETLWAIAARHGVTVQTLAAVNRLASADRLRIGTRIAIPVAGQESARGLVSRPGLTWPSRGVITSRFGFRSRRHHHGIDIAAPIGTPIMAARDGVVQFAGWKGAYGVLVILDHGGGLTTWYGHASKLLVRVGERVQQGQLIAKVGTTGNVTGPNLHFEVRRNDAPLDPLKFLQGLR